MHRTSDNIYTLYFSVAPNILIFSMCKTRVVLYTRPQVAHEIANEASIHGGLPSRLTGLVAWEPWFWAGFLPRHEALQTVGGCSIFGVEF